MANSLLTGISGLRGHQQMLEVIGNNLANVNTTAYKGSRALFGDLMYETQRGASSAVDGVRGSINPMQVGTGSRISQIDRDLAQGNLQATGGTFDMAFDGNGYFMLKSGDQVSYTRAGAFSLDDAGYLVDPSTGFMVQRYGNVGEPNASGPGFQALGDNRIAVPIGARIPGEATSEVNLRGNLSAFSTGPVAETLSSSGGWTVGNAAASATTALNSLDQITTPYGATDSITIAGSDTDGTPISSTFAVTPATTLGDLVTAIDAAYPQSSVSLDTNGRIVAQSAINGPSLLSVSLTNPTTNTGALGFGANPFVVSVAGKDADIVRGGMQIFDERGTAHTLGIAMTKQTDGSWNLDVDLDPSVGTIVDGSVTGVQFQTNGSLSQVTGSGAGDPNIEIQFNGSTGPQTISLAFGAPGSFSGMTEIGSDNSITADPDGFQPGVLSTVQVDGDGVLYGIASNGLRLPLAQLATVSFRNPDGLQAVGNNYFDASLASGEPEVGAALAGGRGGVQGGQLEESNVDLALEFTRLIVAQRGFSANARTITVTDEVLQELTNLIR